MVNLLVRLGTHVSESTAINIQRPLLYGKSLVNFVVTTLAVWIVLILTPLATTAVEIDVASPGRSESVIYFGTTTNERNLAYSSSNTLESGQQIITFPFDYANSRFSATATWVPCDDLDEIAVGGIQLVSPLVTSDIPGTNFGQIRCAGGAFSIPLTLELLPFSIKNFLLLLALSCVISIVLLGILRLSRKNARRESWCKGESAWNLKPCTGPHFSGLDSQVRTPPNWFTAIALGVVTWNIFLTLVGAFRSGISWDEPNHAFMLQGWLDTGIYAEKTYAEEPLVIVFGPVGDLIGHLFAVALGAEGLTTVSFSAEAYAARHLATAFLALIGIISVMQIVRIALGSWRWGITAAALLSAIPMWTGHALFNMKDIAVATGYTLATLGTFQIVRMGKSESASSTAFSCLVGSAGLVLAVGTRISMWLPIFLGAGLALTVAFIHDKNLHGFPAALGPFIRRIALLLISATISYLVLLRIYPRVFGDPIDSILTSASESSDFTIFPFATPRTYIPEWFFHQMPIVIMVLVLIGSFVAITAVLTVFRPNSQGNTKGLAIAATLLLTQAFSVPIVAILVESRLYNGIRHILFTMPAFAAIACLGTWGIVRYFQRKPLKASKYLIQGVFAVVAVGLVIPTVDQSRLFPYGYSYFNVIAQLRGIDGRWPTDYWRMSWRELAGQIPNQDLAVCPDTIPFPNNTMYDWPRTEAFSCAWDPKVAPYLDSNPAYDLSSDRFWFLRENAGGPAVPTNCVPFSAVSRPLRWSILTLSYLNHCHYVPAPN